MCASPALMTTISKERLNDHDAMTSAALHIPYHSTGAFAPLVLDYLDNKLSRSLYSYSPQPSSVEEAMRNRRTFPCHREELVRLFTGFYSGLDVSEKVLSNIASLSSENTFTVCTAHQPNVFTGHLYFLYKILHAIRLAAELNQNHPGNHFVPVFYMGSEDADLAELGSLHHQGREYSWKTLQTGAVGRMKVDEALLGMLDQFGKSFSDGPEAAEVISMLARHYVQGVSIEKATLTLVNELFGKYGLLVFLPDRAEVKRLFLPVISKEILHGISQKELEVPVRELLGKYEVRAKSRDTNLFYLTDTDRERIDRAGDIFVLHKSGKRFSPDELWEEAGNHPERFSPNVILRPLLQEMMLPDVAFIGGGAEVSYWLELKNLFQAAGIHFPILLLRNSFTLVSSDSSRMIKALGLKPDNVFRHIHELEREWILSRDSGPALSSRLDEVNLIYEKVLDVARAAEKGMDSHILALRAAAVNRIMRNEKRKIRAAKKRWSNEMAELRSLHAKFMPGGALQERVDNMMPWLAYHGFGIIDRILENSSGFGKDFCILDIR